MRQIEYLQALFTVTFIFTCVTISLNWSLTNLSNECLSPLHWAHANICKPGPKVHPWEMAASDPVMNKSARIAIIMATDEYLGEEVRKATVKNKQEYADFHGYELVTIDKKPNAVEDLPGHWGKIQLAIDVIKSNEYDFILLIDADTVIKNMNVSLEPLVNILEANSSHMIIGKDLSPINTIVNTGVIFFRSCIWSKRLFTQAIRVRRSMLWDHLPIQRLEDQRAISYLIGEWPKCWVFRNTNAVYPNQDYFRKYIIIIDRCDLQRIPNWYFWFYNFMTMGVSTFDSTEGAFIVHYAGAPPIYKAKMIINRDFYDSEMF